MGKEKLLELLIASVGRVKNELLVFSISAAILLTLSPDLRYWIFAIYSIGSICYTALNVLNKGIENRYLVKFEKFLEESSWRKEFIDNTEHWFCEDNNSYQIEIGRETESFADYWTRVFPDRDGSWRIPVYLMVGGAKVKEIIFIYCDGGRIRIPLPKIRVENEKRVYYFDRDSLEYKLGKLIGRFDSYETIDGVANRSGIEITDA